MPHARAQQAPAPPVIRAADGSFVSQRPPVERRTFRSEAVETTIAEVKAAIADPEVAWLFENCFPNTLDTTVRHGTRDGKPDTFVITGDITAMWLRDSSAQVWPYLSLLREDAALRRLVEGLVRRQTACVLFDPYANAFYYDETPLDHDPWKNDMTAMKPGLHERKWEIDSLCYTIRLAHGYWKATDDASIFDADWLRATDLIVDTFRVQQRKNGPGPYRFQRVTTRPNDTLGLDGYGWPIRPNGMIFTAFRPSDSSCRFHFHIADNLFAVTELRNLAEIHESVRNDAARAAACRELAEEVHAATLREGVVQHPRHGLIFAYEIDGYGNHFFSEDANVPSLVSLPYLGYCGTGDPLYRRTRAFVLSDDNAYFYRGRAAEGVGGDHVAADTIWPMSIILRAKTSTNDAEIAQCLSWLKATHADTGFMHESFHKDDATRFSRSWFAWANTLFGELMLNLYRDRPALLQRTF